MQSLPEGKAYISKIIQYFIEAIRQSPLCDHDRGSQCCGRPRGQSHTPGLIFCNHKTSLSTMCLIIISAISCSDFDRGRRAEGREG